MNSIILIVISLLSIPVLAPFLNGLLGINIFIVYALISYRYSASVYTFISTFIFSIVNDTVLQLNLGSTFLAILLMYIFDSLVKKVVPNESGAMNFLLTTLTYILYFYFIYTLAGLADGDGLRLYSNTSQFLNTVTASLIMSVLTILFLSAKSKLVGVSDGGNIIKLK